MIYILKRVLDELCSFTFVHHFLAFGYFSFNNHRNVGRDAHDSNVDDSFRRALTARNNLPSVTAVYRIKNADEFIALSLQSIIPLASEIVVVDNGSVDETEAIVKKIQSNYIDVVNIKYFKYKQKIARAGNGYADEVKAYPERSIADFYNFCFSKATSEYVVKVDAHCFYNLNRILDVQSYLRKNIDVLYFRGIEYLGKRLSVEPYLFKRKMNFKYVDDDNYEVLKFYDKNIVKTFLMSPTFIHLKRLVYTKGLVNGVTGLEAVYRDK